MKELNAPCDKQINRTEYKNTPAYMAGACDNKTSMIIDKTQEESNMENTFQKQNTPSSSACQSNPYNMIYY